MVGCYLNYKEYKGTKAHQKVAQPLVMYLAGQDGLVIVLLMLHLHCFLAAKAVPPHLIADQHKCGCDEAH